MVKARGLPVRAFGIFILAATVGVCGGLLAVGFQASLVWLQGLTMGSTDPTARAAEHLTTWQRLAVPTLGGLCAGLFLLLVRNRRGPFGIGDIVELVGTRQGTIRPHVSLGQILSSASSIATGSSIGKEGANSQLAATVAAALTRLVHSDSRTRAVLLGCGVAAGMACSYNAPIAGALFVMEVVLGNFAMDVFAPVVVSAVLAILVQRVFVGNSHLYENSVSLDHPGLVLSAIVLGAVCGAGAIVFRRGIEFGAAAFRRTRLPWMVTLGIGGLLTGVIGIWLPEAWGNGYSALLLITEDGPGPGITLLAALAVGKLVATAIATGSGGLGGVFTPNLVVGASLGAFFAAVVEWLVPAAGDHRIAFALVGMAGMCAGTTHAPITAVILVFEMTVDYGLILPLLLCCIVASVTARLFDRDSIYTARMRARGHGLAGGIEELTMQRTTVRDLMRGDVVKVRDTDTFDLVLETFAGARRDSVFAVDEHDHLVGHVHIHDVKHYMNDPTLASVVIAGDLTRPTPQVGPDETLAQVMDRFDDPDLDEVAVVAPGADGDPRLLGRLTRRDVIACLSSEVLQTRQLRARLRPKGTEESIWIELPADVELRRVVVPTELHGRALDSLDLPAQGVNPLLVVTTQRDGTELRTLAEPATVLLPGSSLIVLGERGAVAALWSDGGASTQ